MDFDVGLDRPDASVRPEPKHCLNGLAYVGANVDEVLERMPAEGLVDVAPLVWSELRCKLDVM